MNCRFFMFCLNFSLVRNMFFCLFWRILVWDWMRRACSFMVLWLFGWMRMIFFVFSRFFVLILLNLLIRALIMSLFMLSRSFIMFSYLFILLMLCVWLLLLFRLFERLLFLLRLFNQFFLVFGLFMLGFYFLLLMRLNSFLLRLFMFLFMMDFRLLFIFDQ